MVLLFYPWVGVLGDGSCADVMVLSINYAEVRGFGRQALVSGRIQFDPFQSFGITA